MPKPPVHISPKKVSGDLPSGMQEDREEHGRRQQRAERDDQSFDHADRARAEAAAFDRGEATMAVTVLPPSPGFKALDAAHAQTPPIAAVKRQAMRRAATRAAARPNGQVMEPWTPSSR